jgi:hypothetical protein
MGKKIDAKSRDFYLLILYFILIAILIGVSYLLYKLFVYRCDKCRFKVRISNEIISIPTKDTPGLTIQSYTCKRCGFNENKRIVTYYATYHANNIFEIAANIFKSRKRKKKRERNKTKFRNSSK